MDTTLIVMAAGMGSRFGELKQLVPMGVSGETVAEFSVFDAMRAGFTRVLFIIKAEMEEAFRTRVLARFAHKLPCDLVFQDINDVPAGCFPPDGRVKPLGTAHALWSCRNAVNEPFLVINADDFYGASAFSAVHDFLVSHTDAGAPHPYCVAAYALANTVSQHGSVSRGVCTLDANGNLEKVVERVRIERVDGTLHAIEPEASIPLAEDAPVSLNTWGFHPSIFDHLERVLRAFLEQPAETLAKAECYLPAVVEDVISRRVAFVRALPAQDRWIGITYAEDREPAKQLIAELVRQGKYPENLWA